MKISKQDRLLPHLGLLNFEGDAVRAYRRIGDDNFNNFIIVDDHMEIIAEWDSLEIFEFTRGDFSVTTSYGKDFKYTDWNDDCKPKKQALDIFIGIVELPVIVEKISRAFSTVTEEDLKRNSIANMQMINERNTTPVINVKYIDDSTKTHKDIADILYFLNSLVSN
jgi:hypothetical protein